MSTQPTLPGSPAPVREGDILASKYRVEKLLGVGGMGVVVAAEHIELSQKVALKFLLKEAASSDELVGRFLREARASVRLKGSHVAKTLDVGRLDDGCPYIVMEFLDGHDLHVEIRSRNGSLAIDDAASYVVQAAEGLAEAHSLGIVHRDLKPGNLFLTRGVDGRPLVKVLDFGISKTMDPVAGGDGLSLTKTEMLLGSPLYMSPEQMRSSKHVDERSDIWGLGAIAFELLTGRVPFDAPSLVELCFKVAQEDAPSPKLLRPDLPDALCAAVLRCLERDPDKRFPNVGELAQAFEPFALPRDRGTAERALDVLGAGTRPPMRSDPDLTAGAAEAPSAVGARSPSGSLASTAPTAPQESGVPLVTPSGSELVAPAAWGATQARRASKSRRGLVAIFAGVVVLGALAGGVVSRRGTIKPSAAAAGSPPPPATAQAEPGAGGAAVVSGADTDTVAAPPTTGVAVLPTPEGEAGAAASSAPVSTPPSPTRPVKPARSVATAASVTRPAATPASTPGAVDPGGFIKVRE